MGMATYIEPGVVQDKKSKSFIFHQKIMYRPIANPRNVSCFFFLETFFAV